MYVSLFIIGIALITRSAAVCSAAVCQDSRGHVNLYPRQIHGGEAHLCGTADTHSVCTMHSKLGSSDVVRMWKQWMVFNIKLRSNAERSGGAFPHQDLPRPSTIIQI